jgi:Putative auto-transporter adhesin, head GIN domain
MRTTSGVVVAALVALLAGCANLGLSDDFNGVVGEGPILTQTRQVGAFTGVQVGGGIHLRVQVGAEQSVQLAGQENILEILDAEVEGGILHIRNSANYSASREVTLTISVESLDDLDLSGGAEGAVRGVESDELAVVVSGGAELTIEGRATDLHLEATGGAQAHLAELEVENAHIECSGGAQAELNAGAVMGEASGGATVDVNDDAMVDVEVSGGSQVN